MLSEFIRVKVELKLGFPILSERDCRDLARSVLATTNFRISEHTLVTFFGINKESGEPKLYTLGVLAIYLGYENFERMNSDFKMESLAELKGNHLAGKNVREYQKSKEESRVLSGSW